MVQTKAKAWKVAFVVVVAALVLNAGRLAARRYLGPLLAGGQPTIVASTVVLRAVMREPGKPADERWLETRAVRSDGAIVRLEEGQTSAGPYVRRDIYLPNGVYIATDDVTELKNTSKFGPMLKLWRDPASNCLNTPEGVPRIPDQKIVGRSRVDKFEVIQIHITFAIQSYAPELGCAMLHGEGVTTAKGSMAKEAVTIKVGEPDPSLFRIPASFREVSSAELSGRR